MQITSAHLTMRLYTPADAPLFCAVMTNEAVMRYAYHDRCESTAEAQALFADILSQNKELPPQMLHFAMQERESGAYVGMGLIEIQRQAKTGGCAEIGYFLMPEFWGKGYATQAAAALTNACFTTLGFHRVCASCNAQNPASERVMQKLGMQKEGVFREVRPKNGQWHDELRYAVLKTEWPPETVKSYLIP